MSSCFKASLIKASVSGERSLFSFVNSISFLLLVKYWKMNRFFHTFASFYALQQVQWNCNLPFRKIIRLAIHNDEYNYHKRKEYELLHQLNEESQYTTEEQQQFVSTMGTRSCQTYISLTRHWCCNI